MSTKQTPTAQPIQTTPTRTAENAPFTFDPFNTNPTPEMFSDKWESEDR